MKSHLMKSYLSLIPISAKVHRRQSRMTLLCIIFSVFMVTAVFSMAEMGARMEYERLLGKHGSLSFRDIINSEMGRALFLTAAWAFVLILAAGVLMIAGSINSSVAQRTKFFGMMRCIGMSKEQIVRFVRLEALNWCKIAIPAGLLMGIVCTWILCAILRFVVREEFGSIPLFGISFTGIISGVIMGLVTVLLAARAPAKRAARVSPVTAVSGNADGMKSKRNPALPHFMKIETALGIDHAVSARKNLFLMTGSFALSIILFLSFSVLVDFVGYLMPQSASASDIDIASVDGTNAIDSGLLDTISGMEGVKQVYGRRSSYDVPAKTGQGDGNMGQTGKDGADFAGIDFVSFGSFDLDCLEKDGTLQSGSDLSKVYGSSRYVLATWDPQCSWEIGDKIETAGEELEIAGLLKYDPFSGDGMTGGKMTLITSDETFVRLTGITDYSLVMIQTAADATDADVEAIREAAGSEYIFNDKRDERTSGTYNMFVICIYGFLAIITLVSVLNIVNSISMSVSAKTKQYGAMRAVGMDGRQITKMILAEAFTYAFWGCAAGCVIGLPLSRFLYGFLITNHFSYAVWRLPVGSLAVILFFVVFAAALAAYAPAKRMRKMSVTETINEL